MVEKYKDSYFGQGLSGEDPKGTLWCDGSMSC